MSKFSRIGVSKFPSKHPDKGRIIHTRENSTLDDADKDNLAIKPFVTRNFPKNIQKIPAAQRYDMVDQIQRTQGNASFLRSFGLTGDLSTAIAGDYHLIQRQGTETAEEEGNPVAPPEPGTSIHPTVRRGSSGPAVEELQEKLNQAGVAEPPLVVDGIFGPLTYSAVTAFQRQYGLDVDGIVGPLTWGMMDDLGLSSDVGRVNRQWSEQVGGVTYSMTSRYTWRITDAGIRITVKLKFTGVRAPGLVATMFDAIRSTWNRFAAVNPGTGESLDITFDPQEVASGEDNIVRLRPGNNRSDAANWYVGDPDINETASHEFGHMVGLEDEYQRTHRDYKRLVGEEPPAGETENAANPADVATELHTALQIQAEAARVAAANAVITGHHLAQGDYAQQVATAYQTAFGVEIVRDIVAHIPDEDQWDIVDPFTYTSTSIMGSGADHNHPVEPRHVREFVGYIQALKGGTWHAEER